MSHHNRRFATRQTTTTSFPEIRLEGVFCCRQWRRNEIETWGAPIRSKAPENFFCSLLHYFGSKSTISRFGERFRDDQYSLVSFLFAVLLTVPPPRAQPFVKVAGHVPHGVGATSCRPEHRTGCQQNSS